MGEAIRGSVLLDISDFPWSECAISENRVMHINDSLSLKRTKRNTGAHRYEFELVTYEMDSREGRGYMAKLSAAVDDTLTFIHPRFSYSHGTEPASKIKASGSNLAGDKEITLTSIESWQLMAGDYIQAPNDSKVYQVAEDTLLAIGSQTVKLTSSLRNSITSDSEMIVNDIVWYLSSNGVIEAEMDASDGQEIQLTLVAVEQL